MDHFQFVFELIAEDKKDILIALLDNIGFEGFEDEGGQLKAFINVDNFDQGEFNYIIEQNGIKYLKSTIKQINWNKKWESGFDPVLVLHPTTQLPFVCIRANFHLPFEAIQYDLVITPKMSFGTGHHATTYLMIQQLSMLDLNEKIVIDFGTGTGILAILAEKLGASKVTGIDIDDWSINNAKENIGTNHCKKTSLIKAGTITQGMKADIILANINLNIILANLEALKAACNPGATILFSGFMLQDEIKMTEILRGHFFIIKGCFTKDNWLAILAVTE